MTVKDDLRKLDAAIHVLNTNVSRIDKNSELLRDEFINIMKVSKDVTEHLIENHDEQLKLYCYELAVSGQAVISPLKDAKDLYAWVTNRESEDKDETQD